MKTKTIIASVSLVLLVIVTAFAFSIVPTPQIARAANTATALSGWGWSDTIGWISFQSSPNFCEGATFQCTPSNVAYEVDMDNTSGNLSGYAWSPNIGWIDFNGADLAGCPSGGSTCQPNINTGTGAVSGWARACAGTINGDCKSAKRTDGWDGWIELAGTNHLTGDTTGNAGMTYYAANHQLVGFAWGKDAIAGVLGWIGFGNANTMVTQTNNPNYNPQSPCDGIATVCFGTETGNGVNINIDANGYVFPAVAPVTRGNPITVSWTSATSPAGQAQTCTTSDELSVANPPISGNTSIPTSSGTSLGQHKYTITCSINGSNPTVSSTASAYANVQAAGALAVSCAPSLGTVTTGSTVTWTAQPSGGTSPYTYSWTFLPSTSGDHQASGITSINPRVTYQATGTKTATVTVKDGANGSVTQSCSIPVSVSDNPVFIEF